MTEKQSNNGMMLVHQYRGVTSMIQQNYARRTATNRFYISIGSGLLVFLSYAVDPEVDVELQNVAITLVAALGLLICLVWALQIRALRHLIDIQIGLVNEMEKSMPFDFFSRQQELLQQPRGGLKYGAVEQFLPLMMSVPYLVLIGAVYFI